ncbi:DNA repair protein RecN [Apibacter raozihei]|uniref:DNA repair protein RecN n=1 Tax=Apibacter raozihei TaxID=2500547 RepID=UPI000FE32D65|nr:DNA repair protein RecN [Apibacter raozihei]
MLHHLSIRNYALIDVLDISIPSGMTTLTGETGAGKSIILGALKLVMGERADLKSLKKEDVKCIIEAEFILNKDLFAGIFKELELDFEEHTYLRREILPSGKSRAFVNDSPVTLDVLQKLSAHLLDIHSQFETSQLLNENYQLRLLDNFSSLKKDLNEYKIVFDSFRDVNKRLAYLQEKLAAGNQDFEYSQYLLNELESAELDHLNFTEVEEELNVMKNSEFLAQLLSETKQILDNDDLGLLVKIQEILSRLDKGTQISSDLDNLESRIQSVKAELQDISDEAEIMLEKLEFNPAKFEEYTQKVNLIHGLLVKHKVSTIEELVSVRDELRTETSSISDFETEIADIQNKLHSLTEKLTNLSQTLHKKRKSHIPLLETKLVETLARLGMDKSTLTIDITDAQEFTFSGRDKISILFSANTGMKVQPIAKAISGGERSRVMMAIKKIMAENEELPTLIFDEIDTGVSGRIANEMGKLMKEMALHMQLITITHLPQVAAKGNTQFKVEKKEVNGETITQVRELNHEERIEEIAQLLSGSDITDSARQQAISLFSE